MLPSGHTLIHIVHHVEFREEMLSTCWHAEAIPAYPYQARQEVEEAKENGRLVIAICEAKMKCKR